MTSLMRLTVGFWSLGGASLANSKLLSFLPSMEWDGIDGRWSTFELEVGTPPQTIRLLPGTSTYAGSVVLAVSSSACGNQSTVPNCTESRGSTFASNHSETWSIERLLQGGNYELEDTPEKLSGLEGSAAFGFDVVGFPCPDKPVLDGQLVAAYDTNDFWVGSLGLSPRSFRAENCTEDTPTVLRKLYDAGHIDSLSWGYTAGAFAESTFASLTLGGYDGSRLDENNSVTAPIVQNSTRDMIVSLRSLTYDTLGSTPLVQDPIDVLPDSMVPHLWLPVTVCKQFEQAFNLTWDESSELYILDQDTHAALKAQNPTFTFELAAPQDTTGNKPAQIVMPYSAFDLNVSAPLVDSESMYFPLKRARNETQYTLGRAFFQAAYVVADYDRSEFRIAQALYPATGTAQNLVSIIAPSNATAPEGKAPGLEGGEMAGVTTGIAVVSISIVAAAVIWWRRRRAQEAASEAIETDHGDLLDEKKACSSVSSARSIASTPQAELSSDGTQLVELDGSMRDCAEMDALDASHGQSKSKHSQEVGEVIELPTVR